jgi:hypothetical protein
LNSETQDFGKIAEDCALAVQSWDADGYTREALTIRLAMNQRLGLMVSLLQEQRTQTGRAVNGVDVLAVANRILRIEERKPLVITGQGTSRKEYYEEDLAGKPAGGLSAWYRRRFLGDRK